MAAKRQNTDEGVVRPIKKTRLMSDDEDSSDEMTSPEHSRSKTYMGASPPRDYLKINKDYARRFEYNKKREEQQQCKMNL